MKSPRLPIEVRHVYVKNLSWEVTSPANVPQVMRRPVIDYTLDTRLNPVPGRGDLHEVIVYVRVSGSQDGVPIFVLELSQAGIFSFPVGHGGLQQCVGYAAAILLPYARKVIASAMTSGGFQPVLVADPAIERYASLNAGNAVIACALPYGMARPDLGMPSQARQPEPVAPLHPENPAARPEVVTKPDRHPRRVAVPVISLSAVLLLTTSLLYWRNPQKQAPVLPAPVAARAPARQELPIDQWVRLGRDWLADQPDVSFVLILGEVASPEQLGTWMQTRREHPAYLLPARERGAYLIAAGAYPTPEAAEQAARELDPASARAPARIVPKAAMTPPG